MAQQFGEDAQMNTVTVNLPNGAETAVLTTNFLNPPFGTCKAAIQAILTILTGVGATGLQLKIRRNPNGENVVVNAGVVIAVGASVLVLAAIGATDANPDGRPVQYQVTATVSGGAAAATAQIGCYIDCELLSG